MGIRKSYGKNKKSNRPAEAANVEREGILWTLGTWPRRRGLAGLHADGRRGLLGWLLLVADAVWSLLGL